MNQFLLISIVLFSLLVFAGRVQIARYRRNADWNRAPAKVTEVDVRLETFGHNNFYQVTIRYEYTAGEQHYVGAANHPEVFFNKEGAHELQERYPIGSEVQIRYNPGQLNESRLHTYAEGYRAAAVAASFSALFVLLLLAFLHFGRGVLPSSTGVVVVLMAGALFYFLLLPIAGMFRSE